MLSRRGRTPSEHPFADVMYFGFGPEGYLDIDLEPLALVMVPLAREARPSPSRARV
jgi:hypothetical protein